MPRNKSYIRIGPFYYKFRLRASILTVFALIILIYLGCWQLNRAQYKQYLMLSLEQKITNIPVMLHKISEPTLIKDRFTPVYIQGTYLNKYTFLIDNQMHDHQAGYRIITAFQSPYLDKLVLIDRGWIARTSDRNVIPPIKDIYGIQKIEGVINHVTSGITLTKEEQSELTSWPYVIQTLDYQAIQKHLPKSTFEFVVRLRYPEDIAAYKLPPIDFGLPSNKHLSYALQWFSFALLLIIYYIVLSFKREKD